MPFHLSFGFLVSYLAQFSCLSLNLNDLSGSHWLRYSPGSLSSDSKQEGMWSLNSWMNICMNKLTNRWISSVLLSFELDHLLKISHWTHLFPRYPRIEICKGNRVADCAIHFIMMLHYVIFWCGFCVIFYIIYNYVIFQRIYLKSSIFMLPNYIY